MQPYIILPHTADLRIKVFGSTKEELFSNAMLGMFEAVEPVYSKDAPLISRSVETSAKDINALLIDFLNEVLYFCDTNDEAYNRVDIKRLSDTEIEAIIFGRKITGFKEEIKAVTYHGVHLKQVNEIWEVEIIFDV